MRYAVAYMNLIGNEDLGIALVIANDPIDAIIKGVNRIADPDQYFEEWLGNLQGKTLEEVKQGFADGDQVVAVMAIE